MFSLTSSLRCEFDTGSASGNLVFADKKISFKTTEFARSVRSVESKLRYKSPEDLIFPQGSAQKLLFAAASPGSDCSEGTIQGYRKRRATYRVMNGLLEGGKVALPGVAAYMPLSGNVPGFAAAAITTAVYYATFDIARSYINDLSQTVANRITNCGADLVEIDEPVPPNNPSGPNIEVGENLEGTYKVEIPSDGGGITCTHSQSTVCPTAERCVTTLTSKCVGGG